MNVLHKNLAPPIGAGDLIDRSIRFYRRNILASLLIALPPVLIGAMLHAVWIFFVYSLNSEEVSHVLVWFGSPIFWLFELTLLFCVMGGLSRNMVSATLFGTEISFLETYSHVIKKLGSLFLSSLLTLTLLGIILFLLFYFAVLFLLFLTFSLSLIFRSSVYLTTVFSILLFIGTFLGTGWVFFLIAAHFVYIPQIMIVEGGGIFSSLSRSINLARGNVNRVYALFVFTLIIVYVVLALVYVPLLIYTYFSGIEYFTQYKPAWHSILAEVIFQMSVLLSSPILMIGLCLLYIDERIRNEGYDLEILAAKYLEEVSITNPFPSKNEKNQCKALV